MRVFFAGATGVVGRRLLPLLVGAGHEVVAMTSVSERAGALREAGAEPVVCDVFDADRLRAVVGAARPEAVIHQLTRLPAVINPRRLAEAYAANDRVRREGTRNLVEAAEAAGARRMVAQSVAFAYAPVDGEVDEDGQLALGAPAPWGSAVGAVEVLERLVTGAGLEGVALRYGFFYGPGSSFARDGAQAKEVRRRRLPIVGDGSGVSPFIHVDDAASAALAALEGGAPGTYNVVDDEPAPARDWLPVYAEAMGAKPPRRVPTWLARIVAGPAVLALTRNPARPANARFKRAFGWEPRYPSWREGFAEALG